MTQLIKPEFDIAIIGGGIQGAALAYEASKQGYQVLLLEQYHKPACGTSSKSSKLIHGGLRYLESGEFKLVYECLRERDYLLKYFPDLVELKKFYIPIYKCTTRSRFMIRCGLSLYAILGGLKQYNRFKKIPKNQWYKLDGLATQDLLAVYQYYDAQTDDAQLTTRLITQAAVLGAVILFNAEFLQADSDENGVRVSYRYQDKVHTLASRCLINAAGPWVDKVSAACKPASEILKNDLVQGSHIEIRGKLSCGIYYLEAPQDQRAVFAMPWQGHILLGTTEKLYQGDPAECKPTAEEIDYLLAVYQHYFPKAALSSQHIIDAWAGLRVLPQDKRSVFKRNRETVIVANRELNPNIFSIYGGKLTSHHATALKVLKLLNL